MVINNQLIPVGYSEFERALKNAKESLSERMAWRVDAYGAVQYAQLNARCYVTEFGSAVAISPDGTIISLCRHRNDPTLSIDLVESAKGFGGRKIDCYAGFERLYLQCGFEEIDRVGWDDRNAPRDWRPEYGKEDTISFALPLELERERVMVMRQPDKQPIIELATNQKTFDPELISRTCEFINRMLHMEIETREDENKFKKGIMFLDEKLSERGVALEELPLPTDLRQCLVDKLELIQTGRSLDVCHDSIAVEKDDMEQDGLDGHSGR